MKKALALVLIILVLAGCASQDRGTDTGSVDDDCQIPSTGSTENPPAVTETVSVEDDPRDTDTDSNEFASVSDEELVEAVIQSSAIHNIWYISSVATQSAQGIRYVMKECPEFAELWRRESGLRSLEKYGPELVEKYLQSEDSYYRLNAMHMDDLLKYMFNWLWEPVETE